MRTTYTSGADATKTYEIEADRHGNYTIWLEGKVVRRKSALTDYPGKSRWGSKKLELAALDDARVVIDALAAAHR